MKQILFSSSDSTASPLGHWLLSGWMFLYGLSAWGQASITGIVSDSHQGLPSVNVLLFNGDSVLVQGAATDSVGAFHFQNTVPGKYRISASMIGYAAFTTDWIYVGDNDLEVTEIILEDSALQLGEIVVSATKPRVEVQMDRLVINVGSSITAAGNSVLDVLQQSPGVVVSRQNYTVTMNGKSGVRIMIDDRIMQVPLDVAVQMLEGMNASNIEKIELITTPPSKYDAEGNAGIIRLVTKQGSDLGTNGTIGLTLGYRWAETLGSNLTLSHRGKSIAWTVDYTWLRNHNLHVFKLERNAVDGGFIRSIGDDSRRENVTSQHNLSANLEYTINHRTTINIGVTGYRRNWNMDATNTDVNREAVDSTIVTDMKIRELNLWQSVTGSVYMQRVINAKNDLVISVDYLYYNNDNPSGYDNIVHYQEAGTNELSRIDLTKRTPIQFIVSRAEYLYHPQSSFRFEAGVKSILSTLDNNVGVRRLVNNVWTIDQYFTSFSSLNEQIIAGYISSAWMPGTNWQLNSGLRYEYTHTSISSPTQRNLINRKYGIIFPNVLLQKSLGSERDVQFTYAKRITRPTYNDIAPFVFFWGPNTFSGGNTALLPAVASLASVSYHVRQWAVTAQVTHIKNEIVTYQADVDPQTNNLTYRAQNLNRVNAVALTNSYGFSITPWWDWQSDFTARYQAALTTPVHGVTKYTQFALNATVVSIMRLPRNFAIEVAGNYQSAMITGTSKWLPMGSLNAGIQKKLGEKGSIKLSMDDILHTNYWRIKAHSPGNESASYFKYDFHNQFVRVSYSRSLGNNKFQSMRSKSGADDERSRVTN